MICNAIYLVFAAICIWQAPGSVILASGQVQMADVKVLKRGDDWQCPSMEERERARKESTKLLILQFLLRLATFTLAKVHQDGGVLLSST